MLGVGGGAHFAKKAYNRHMFQAYSTLPPPAVTTLTSTNLLKATGMRYQRQYF